MKNVKNRIKIFVLAISCQLCALSSTAQNISINVDGSEPDPSAMLHVISTDKGMLIPKMTEAQKNSIANPATSLIVFQSNGFVGFYFNAGTPGIPSWIRLITENDAISGSSIADADDDTKIQVEEGADDDIIRFDIRGAESMRLDTNTLHLYDGNSSVFVGLNSGLSNTIGIENTGFGIEALKLNISGNTNTAVGFIALKNNTGSLNTAFGGFALTNNVGGNFNTALGRNALRDNVGGSNNVGVGQAAGVQMISADNNIFVGNGAGENKTGGGNNTLIGTSTGFNNGTGTGNVFLGFQSGFNETGSDKLYIETSSSSTPLIYGDFANDSIKIFGILSVGDAFSFPAADGSVGQIMQTNGSGVVSWGSITGTSGSGTADFLPKWTSSSTIGNSSIQDNGSSVAINASPSTFEKLLVESNGTTFTRAISGEHTENTPSTTVGVFGRSNSSDKSNSAGVFGHASNGAFAVYGQQGSSLAGVVAVNGLNSSGGSNANYGVKGQTTSSNANAAGVYGFSFHGGNAVLAESNGRVIKAWAYGARTTSYNAIELSNTATSTTGSIDKTGLNIQSVGAWTGASAINTGLNVSVSGGTTNYAALFNGGNVGIGTSSPSALVDISTDITGNDMVMLSTNGSRSLIIGAPVSTAADSPFTINTGNSIDIQTDGNTGIFVADNQEVGIGTIAPNSRLHVAGRTTTDDLHATLFAPVSTQGSYLQWNRSASGKTYLVNQKGTGTGGFVFAESNASNVLTERMRIDDNGNVGIGENTPIYKLDVGGDINAQGVVRASRIALISDKRFKTEIVSLKKVLPLIMELEGVYHRWDSTSFPDKNFPNQREIGLIAQDLQKVYPELVHEDKQGYLSVDYAKFSAVLLQAVKEQQVQIEQLKADQFNEEVQKTENKKLEAKLALIEKMLLKK